MFTALFCSALCGFAHQQIIIHKNKILFFQLFFFYFKTQCKSFSLRFVFIIDICLLEMVSASFKAEKSTTKHRTNRIFFVLIYGFFVPLHEDWLRCETE